MHADLADQTKNRYLSSDQSGQALNMVQGNYGDALVDGTASQTALRTALNSIGGYNPYKLSNFLFANGQQVGSLQSTGSSVEANFDVNYTPVSNHYPSRVPTEIIVQQGDTLKIIAARVLGDGSLWYLIAQENGLTDPNALLAAGIVLRVPNNVVSLSNSASSFKPFNVSEAIGDTTPTQPMPQVAVSSSGGGRRGCGVLGQILMIVVAIVVTVYTAGLASGVTGSFASTMAAGGTALTGGAVTGAASWGLGAVGASMVGGAAGSIASQLVGNATGNVDGFDWKGVALGAIGAGVGSALGGSALLQSVTKGNAYLGAAVSGAAGNALVQGISVATGLQNKFSWRDVAISAIAAPVAGSVGNTVGAGFMGQVAGGLSGSLVRGSFGGKIDIATVLADAFGNAIGNSIVDASKPKPIDPMFDLGKANAKQEAAQRSAMLGGGSLGADLNFDLSPGNASSAIRSGSETSPDELRYTVQKGDALERIARAHGMGPEGAAAIAAASGIGLKDIIKPGQELVIPSTFDAQNAKAEYAQYLSEVNAQQATAESTASGSVNFSGDWAKANVLGISITELIQSGLASVPPQSFAGGGGSFRGAGASGQWTDPSALERAGYWMDQYQVGTRLLGGLQMIGGAAEAAVGAALVAGGAVTSEVGVGIPIAAGGYGLVLLGSDQAAAGLQTMLQGEPQQSLVARGLQAAGLSPQQAAMGDALINVAGAAKGAAFMQQASAVAPFAVSEAADRGVAFFGRDNLHYYAGNLDGSAPTLGASGRAFFFMPIDDAARVTSPVSAAIESGMAPSAQRAWLTGGDIYGVSFPTAGLSPRLPTLADAMGWRHFRPGGNTAVNVTGTNWFMVNRTRELVVPGGGTMPRGSVIFRVGDSGEWVPLWKH